MNEKIERFIILKKVKYGESDLIIQALGTDGSKSSFMARSALKSKKRFGGGVLEPLHFVSLTYKDSSEVGKMKSLVEASIIDDFKAIKTDYDRLEVALYILNCVSKVSLEGDQNSEFLFNLTGHSLRAMEAVEVLDVLKLQFCLKFLYQQGVISLDPWMAIFLKANMSDSIQLQKNAEICHVTEEYLSSIELLVNQYIKTATTD